MSIFLPNQHLGGETDHHHRDHLVGHQTFHRASLYPISLVISNIIGENDISNIKESDWVIIFDDIGNGYIPSPVVISNIIGKNYISNIKESDWEIISDDIGNDYIPNPVVISNITVEAAAL